VHDVLAGVVRALLSQLIDDLLGAPSQIQPLLDVVEQLRVGSDPAKLGTGQTCLGSGMRCMRPVVAGFRMGVAADPPADRGRAAIQLHCDGAERGLLPEAVSDVDALGLAEAPH
jgi:hypothetical protein